MNEKDLNSGEFSVEKPRKIINNYFSIGIDAKIALSFHTKREESPKKFNSRTVNKIWYAKFGADAMFDAGSCDDLPKKIKLEVCRPVCRKTISLFGNTHVVIGR